MHTIGIDLGTTHSCIGVFNLGKVEIIPNTLGMKTTPSVFAFVKNQIFIGKNALNLKNKYPKNVISFVKRIIGKKNLSELEQKEYYCDSQGNFLIDSRKFSAIEISSYILEYLKKIGETYLNSKIIDVVITVPAYFNNNQKSATIKAAKMAKLNVLRIINEPTAASLCYGINKKLIKENNLVFDFGGGTIDISIITMDYIENIFTVIATKGCNNLGGKDINDLLYNEFKQKIPYKNIEDIKKELSFNETVFIEELDLFYTKESFNKLIEKIIKNLLQLTFDCVYESNYSKQSIDNIILVGGSTRIPIVREMLSLFFKKEPLIDINPDEAIAYGATIQAAIIQKKIKDFVLTDICPMSIGIETNGNITSFLITKNSLLPYSCYKEFSNSLDDQPFATIKIIEGEHENSKLNEVLGTFKLDLPKGPSGTILIKITLSLNLNGMLIVSGETSETKNSIVLEMIPDIIEQDINLN